MILVLDNYDSFTYNLVQYFGELGTRPVVYRNDQITVDQVFALKPAALVLSPGPKTPADAGILVPLVRAALGRLPMLGVCLGHQAMAAAFGGVVHRAERLMHGKTCPVRHSDDELFDGIPSPFTAMRYHSLVADPASLPSDLIPTAWAADQPRERAEIMAMKHRRHPAYGVQFHPESIGTEHGKRLLENFLRVVQSAA
jgi:anthranilate synthase/aminodeoxychorismate synthase-like glutamine amidotransferase